jgi:hypothetical protein
MKARTWFCRRAPNVSGAAEPQTHLLTRVAQHALPGRDREGAVE